MKFIRYALPGSTVLQAGSALTMDRILLHQLRFSPPDAGAENLNVADEFHESATTGHETATPHNETAPGHFVKRPRYRTATF